MITVEVVNIGGNMEFGDYQFTVLINGKVIDSGKVLLHRRELPWYELLYKVCRHAEWRNKPSISGRTETNPSAEE